MRGGTRLRAVPAASAELVAQLCAFRVGAEEYAIDLRRVEEIIQAPPLVRVPRAPAFIDGVIKIRGTIIPVVDLRARLLPPVTPEAGKPKCIVCRLGRELVAILVDSVSQTLRFPKSELHPVPPMLRSAARLYVIGVCGPPGDLKLLLDLRALFQADPPATQGGSR